MTGPPKIPQADWDKHKAYLHNLYIAEGRTLSQVIQQAENEVKFRPSKEQYRRQFKKWKFEKNLRADQWIKIVKAVRNRKSYGKDSEILLTLGRVANKEGRLSDRKLRKEMSRYRSREHDDCSDITNEDMDGIIIGTPQGEDVQAINYLQIPWFRSQALIEPYFDKMRRGDSGLAMSFPSVSAVSDIVQIRPPNEALRLLAGCASTSTDANDIIKKFYHDLESIAIEVRDHERAAYLVQGTGPSNLEQMSLFIRYLVYLSSNSLLHDVEMDKLVQWMVQSKTQWVLGPLLDLRTPTTEIFGSKILMSAARLGEIDVVRSLIARGIDVDATTRTLFKQAAWKMVDGGVVHWPHPRTVELLLNAGADPKMRIAFQYPLLYCLVAGPYSLEILKMLYDKGTDFNAVEYNTDFKDPFLPTAVKRGDHKITRFLLEAGANIDAVAEDQGTALQVAVRYEDVEAVRLLIDAGADINGPVALDYFDDESLEAMGTDLSHMLRTPIQQASLTGNAEIVQILVDEGADVNAFQWGSYGYSDPWEEYRRHQWDIYDDFECTESYDNIIMTPLQAAVFNRNPLIVRVLLAAGASVDAKGYGDTPFQMAAALDEAEIMQTLRRHGADVNAPAADEGGMTALQAAARAGNFKLVQEMLVSGSDVNATASPSGGRTALQAAAEGGNVELAEILIEAGANVNADASPIDGRTCLQAAVDCRHVEMVLMLLAAGADVNGSAATIAGGLTALQAALWPLNPRDKEPDFEYDYKASDVRKTKQPGDANLQVLFDAGANISAPSSPHRGMITILAAVKTGRPDLVRRCLQGGADPNISYFGTTVLGAAVYQQSVKTVNLLIEAGADVNAYCEMDRYTLDRHELPQWSALHVAARRGSIEIANLLLEAGAEINMPLPQPHSLTTLQSAMTTYDVRMVQFLLDKGANPHIWGAELPPVFKGDLSGPLGLWVLSALAVAGGDFDQIADVYELPFDKEDMQEALDLGVLTDWTAEQKGHLLQAGIRQGHSDLIQRMLDAGAEVNTPATLYWGRTALQKAAENGCTDLVTLLLSYGADVNAPAGYYGGVTALQGAALNGNLKIVLTLLQAGAEINAAPAVRSGRTSLQAAAEHGRLDVLSLLLDNDHDTEGMELRCESAAAFADRGGHKVIARILREHKAGQSTTD